MSFIERFIDSFSQAESPKSFFRWSAIAAISAVVRKNVYINKRIYKLYPNLYIMLVAKSGLRKGYPVKQAQKLIEQLEVTKVISGRSSIQSILTELSKQWTLESTKILKNAQAIIVNDELDSLLVGDPQAQTILTALYDSFYHKQWKNTLKKDGTELLNDLYVTMLTATNPEHLDHFLDKSSYKGGFLGRTLLVYETKKSRINPLIEENDISEIDTKPLAKMLEEIALLNGQISFDKEAIKTYKEWYQSFYERLEKDEIEDDTGTAERAGDTVLKLSLIHSLDVKSMMIKKDHIETSIGLFYDCASSAKRVLIGSGKSEIADKVKTVLTYLLSKPNYQAFRKQIIAAKYGDIDSADLARVLDTLEAGGIIEIIVTKDDGPLIKISSKYASKLKEKFGE